MTLCPDCGEPLINTGAHLEECRGQQPVHEVAQAIANGHVFVDADAVRVAREYLALSGIRRDTA